MNSLEGYGDTGDGTGAIGGCHEHLVGQSGRLNVIGPAVHLGGSLGREAASLEEKRIFCYVTWRIKRLFWVRFCGLFKGLIKQELML